MSDIIDVVNTNRNVPHTELRSLVKRVAVILSSSRSGSSLLKSTLVSHLDIATLDGEIEPYLALTRNGFGYNSDCDAIHLLSNADALADNIFDDLTVPSKELMPINQLRDKWKKRMLLQFPLLFSNDRNLKILSEAINNTLCTSVAKKMSSEKEWKLMMLSNIFKNEPWRICYYDGGFRHDARVYFDELVKIEEPPFVTPQYYRRKFIKGDIENKILLFKTPPDVYRIGMYEKIFPNADIKYLHLTRGYAQSINGLMDGWLSPVGFFSHDMREMGLNFDIKGYSDVVEFGKRWWKFELPPNWKEFVSSNLEDVCLNQWISIHKEILTSGIKTVRIPFEEFLSSPLPVVNRIFNYLGLREFTSKPQFQLAMTTEYPRPMRWKKREKQLLAIGQRSEVRSMMESLDYDMNPETWL